MAGRPKKTTTTKTTATEVNNIDIKELQEQLAILMEENKKLKAQKEAKQEEVEQEEEITYDTDIEVISQTVGKLVVSTEGNGSGTVYRFEHFGEIQDIPFGDLKDIVKNKPRFAKEGAYFICNPNAVKKLRLGTQYKNLIDERTFSHLFEQNSNTIISLYESAPKMQREQIVSLIEDKIDKGIEVDGNVLIKIGRLCGKDFLANKE